MAIMIPPQIDESKPDGEKKSYRFLESVAKPDQKFTIWYLPHVEGREPDFILLCDEIGLIIFEVKDWVLQQIMEASSDEFKLMMGHKEEPRKNPLRLA